MLIEACVENLPQAILAERNHAHRLELCADLAQDGLTPPSELFRAVISQVTIPVRVMIRPRPGNFVYSGEEIDRMIRQIKWFRSYPVDGFVFGLLDGSGEIDLAGTERLVAAAKPFHVTIHKAVDATPDPVRTVKKLKKITGISSVLTSGGAQTALEGAPTIREMIAVAGTALEIIACGRVTADNLEEVHQLIGAMAYHGRRIVSPA